MKRFGILALLAGSLLVAESNVLTTPNGKAYHARRTCMSLSRSKQVAEVSESSAAVRGLKKCGICYRSKKQAAPVTTCASCGTDSECEQLCKGRR